jgi:hypothetical protein
MNERIKKLAEQAGHKPLGTFADELMDIYNKKFAELIIKECVNEIYVADVGDLKGKSYYLDKVAEHIEKHFGVEE